jgi:aminoglycoside phosphotransferase (APT) family kinase protein
VSATPLDRTAAFSGTREVAEALAIDLDSLANWMVTNVPDFAGPLSARQFAGGQSNPTFLLSAPSGEYVLRRKPTGALLPSAHAVDREFRVQRALGAVSFPVPRVHALCEDATILGTMFYVMDRVPGRVVWEPSMPGATPAERAATYDAMNATLARLHAYDPGALGLADYGRAEAYVARQIGRWTKQYAASATEDIPEMARLADWLPSAVPPEPRAALVHGDYRLDNLILAPDAAEVRAVLDWELSTLGDPLADVTYHLMPWIMPRSETGSGTGSLLGHDLAALGIPDMEPYARAYAARTGLDPLPRLEFYLAYNFFRLAAILQGILGRARDGTAVNASAVAMAAQVRPLAEEAWHWAKAAGAR